MYRSLSPRHMSPYECTQNDIHIAVLRRDIAQFQDSENNLIQINNHLAKIQSSFALLLDQKEKYQRQLRIVQQVTQRESNQQLRQIAQLKSLLNITSNDLNNTQKDISSIERRIKQKIAEMDAHRQTNYHLNSKIDFFTAQNKTNRFKLKELKDLRINLSKQCDISTYQMNTIGCQIKNLDKQTRKIDQNVNVLGKNNQKQIQEQNRMNIVIRDQLLELKVVKEKLQDLEIVGEKQCLKIKQIAKSQKQYVKIRENTVQNLEKSKARSQGFLSQIQQSQSVVKTTQIDILVQIQKNKLIQAKRKELTTKNTKLNTQIICSIEQIHRLEKKQRQLQQLITNSQRIDKQTIQVLQNRLSSIDQCVKDINKKLVLTADYKR